jgi:GntR family transcriptional regulator
MRGPWSLGYRSCIPKLEEMTEPFPYRKIAGDLRAQIVDGKLREGERLPSENQLASSYDTTRTTVRKALALLRSEGYLVSEQGRGVFVRIRPEVRLVGTGSRYAERRGTGVTNYNAEAQALGHQAHQLIEAVDRVPASSELAERLELTEGAPLLVRRRRFFVDGHPMQLVDGFYPYELAKGTRLARKARIKGGAHAEIEGSDVGKTLSRFVEELEIRMPSPEETQALLIPPGVPVARVLRTAYTRDGEPVEVLVSVVPADRHRFVYEISLPV